MAKCRYEYFDNQGNPSEFYYNNKAIHGDEVAHAMFIADALKTDTIKFSTESDNSLTRLKEKHSYSELGKKGYKGVTSIIDSTETEDTKKRIKNNMAINIKIREELIKAHQGKKNAEDFVYIKKNPNYHDIRNEVLEYFGYENNVATKNIDEFKALEKDAAALLELQTKKGDLQHLLLEQVFIAKNNAAKQGKDYFDDYFKDALEEFEEIAANSKEFPDGNTLNNDVIHSLKAISRELVKKADELNKKYGVNDFEFLPEVSVFTDKIKHNGKSIQGRIDLLLYSPSSKLAHVIDYKTKSEQSFANYDNTFKRMAHPFDDLPQSAENKTALQTNIYSLILEQEYGATVVGNEVLLLVSKYSDGNINEEKVAGQREWKVNNIDHLNSKITELKNLKGLVSTILNIAEPKILGTKNSEELISELFDEKLVTVINSKTNFVNRQEAKIKEKDGRFTWYNVNNPSNSVNTETKEEALKAIGNIYEEFMEAKKKAASDLVLIFNTDEFPDKTIWNSSSNRNKAAELLQKYHKETHILESANEVPGIGKDVIIATNKMTGEVDLISIATVFNTNYDFNETDDEGAKTTIFGTILDDVAVNKEYGKGNIPSADTHTLTHMRLALLAAELKIRDPKRFSGIAQILSTTLSDDSPYNYSDLDTQMGFIKEIVKLKEKYNQPVPTELKVIVNDPSLSGKGAFDVNHFEAFAKKMAKGMDPLKLLMNNKANLNNRNSEDLRRMIKESIKQFNEDRFNFQVYNKIEKDLMRYVQTVFGALLSKHKTKEAVYRDSMFITANRAWLSFKGWMTTGNPEFKGHILGQINSLTTLGDKNAENLHLAISEYEQKSRDEILEIFNEHQKLQKELLDEAEGVGLVGSVFDPNNFKKVFQPMLKDGFDFNNENVDDWMKFKDPEDMTNNLTDVQRRYIRFYAKIVKQASKKLFTSNFKLMYPDTESEAYKIKKWDDYSIPILPASASLDLQEFAFSRKGMEASAALLKRILTRGSKTQAEKSTDVITPWNYSSMFPEQVDSAPGRNSKDIRNLMNIADDNTVIENKRRIELNPITVLNMMVVEASRAEHMKAAAFASFAMQAELAYKEMYAGVDTKELRKIMSNISSLRIQNKVKEEGTLGKVLDSAKTAAAMGLFWGGARQFFTETATATTQITSQSIANVINKSLFKGVNKYDNKDQKWAGKMLFNPLGEQIIHDSGLYNTSLGQFTSDEYNETKKKLAWQTKHGFWFVQKTLRQAVKSITLAQMHKQGITENCYKFDEEKGKYFYDETKDPRFYVYDENNAIEGQQSEAPQEGTEDYRKWQLWIAHREVMAKEGGLFENGRMKRPFVNKEMQSIKNYAIRLLGAMDNSEVMAVEYGAIGRALFAFKRYLRQKVTNYIGTTEKTFREGEWELNGEGNYEFVEKDFEGMLNSLWGIVKDMSQGYSLKGALGRASDMRKRNLAKLLADLLLGAALAALVSMMFKSELFKDSVLGMEFAKGVRNASSDIIPVFAVSDALTGSPMAPVSIGINTVSNVYSLIGYAVTGDVQNALKAADQTMNLFGVYRTGKSFVDLLVEFESEKQ